ncbi:MAG: hypothetical protein JW874_07230, partial [Spirochaetales bacterium]|nr:hypothetical protein [Spirochaetales bacterium]
MKKKYMFICIMLFAALVSAQADPIVIDVLAYGQETELQGQIFLQSVMEFEDLHPGIEIRYELAYKDE